MGRHHRALPTFTTFISYFFQLLQLLLATLTSFIGASLSEPHIDEKYMRDFYIYIYIYSTSVTRAPPYTKHIGRMKYLAMKNPRQEKSIADHVDVCDRDQASQRYTADRCYHVV